MSLLEGIEKLLHSFRKTPIDLYVLKWSYKCFGCWLSSSSLSVFHKWRKINEIMHVIMKQTAACLWKVTECGLFFTVTLLQPSGFSFCFSALFNCNSWQTCACLSPAYTLLAVFSYVLMTPLLRFPDCYAAALYQILITLHGSLSLLCLSARFRTFL